MYIDGGVDNLTNNLITQLKSHWSNLDLQKIQNSISAAIDRVEVCLKAISKSNKYVWRNNELFFSPMHSVQYSLFLYYLSKELQKFGGGIEADSVYYLNKLMNSVDWFYGVDLPNEFFAEHPLGSVLGRAVYGNRFMFYQGCTVGGNRDKNGNLVYPVIGKNVLMYANSSILG